MQKIATAEMLERKLGKVVYCGDFFGPLSRDGQGFYIKSDPPIRDCALGNGDEILFDHEKCFYTVLL